MSLLSSQGCGQKAFVHVRLSSKFEREANVFALNVLFQARSTDEADGRYELEAEGSASMFKLAFAVVALLAVVFGTFAAGV
jgi:hypothetical protein